MAKQTLAEAVKKTNVLSKLDQLDSFGTSKESYEGEDELSVIETVAGDFIKRVKANIQGQNLISTGAIEDISIVRDEEGVKIYAPIHLVYQDRGVNGSKIQLYQTPYSFKTKKPPIEPFLEWIKKKGIEDESAAYAIREKVFQEGISPKNIYTKEIPLLAEQIANHIAGFNANRIVEIFKK
ncbi:MAG: hypothetical protein J0I41_00105 [Filimonas sp.]|nr:hypothetical protein [Filimonas sp.]